jgi:LPPG:FO 2-phospho-L-lactate transferase
LDLIQNQKVVVLVGGVGGAKLALGLQQVVASENLTIIVNTGDDFWHYGLRICPDIDTVLYTLSGRVDSVNGWGLAEDSTTTLDTLKNLGEEPWFRLGDKDIATHLLRTHMLREGYSLTEIVQHLAKVMNIQPTVLPMSDAEIATILNTEEYGELKFQEYFVKYRWQPTVTSIRFTGVPRTKIPQAVRKALEEADVILFGPSNPWLSIAPILAIPRMRDLLKERDVPRVAVTPIVAGQALKGPAAKLMKELDYDEVSAQLVAQYYGDVITAFAYDKRDASFEAQGLKTVSFDTIMLTDEDKARLAHDILLWINEMEQI